MAANPDGFASLEEVADAIASYNPHRPWPTDLSGLRKNVRQRADGRWVWHWVPSFIGGGTVPDETARASSSPDASSRTRALCVCRRCSCEAARATC